MATGRQRYLGKEGEYVSLEALLDWNYDFQHRLPGGRAVPILIWGGMGIGKCVDPDTEIVVNGRTLAIAALWKRYAVNPVRDQEGIWAAPKQKLVVPCLDHNMTMTTRTVKALYRQRVKEPMFTVTLHDGTSLTCTGRHRLRGPSSWLRASELAVGYQIAVPAQRPWKRGDWQYNLQNNDVIFQAVASIHQRPYEGWVYDLEVEELHNYVAQNIITHNTAQIQAYCNKRNLQLREYHPSHDVDGGGVLGVASVNEQANRLEYALPSYLPVEEDAPGILFIDEINRAPELVLASLMEPIGSGTISQSQWHLPKHWMIVAAANPRSGGYIVNDMDEAMVDRFLHYAPGFDAPYWARWAQTTDEPVHPIIVNFALRHSDDPEILSVGEQQLPDEISKKLRATPRSLTYFNALYEPGMNEGLLRVVSDGLLGRTAAKQIRQEIAEYHQGLKPLDVETLLSGKYAKTLQRWEHPENKAGQGLILATSQLIIAHLVDRDVDPQLAERVGYWLYNINASQREAAYESIYRSAPQWLAPLQSAVEVWIQKRAGDTIQ